jgi:hypothetical protein
MAHGLDKAGKSDVLVVSIGKRKEWPGGPGKVWPRGPRGAHKRSGRGEGS